MPQVSELHTNWSAGELSPLMRGRVDFARYKNGAKRIENMVVLLTGGLQKRMGFRYVASTKLPARAARLAPFIFRSVDALVLEIGHEYIRFYKNGARVEVASVPVEVTTPYQEADVFQLRLVQKNDVVYILHRSYATRKLERLSDTEWILALVGFDPPPSTERGFMPATILTLSALTGTGVTATTSGATWLTTDVNRTITSGVGRAVIRTVASTTSATVDILEAFT